MNDTLAVKDLAISTVGATQLPGSARNFARVHSVDSAYRRVSNHINANGLSPTTIRVAHTPRNNSVTTQRSLIAIDQDLTRLDASSNPISKVRFKVAFQADIPEGVALAEYRTACATLFGALLETDGALLTSIYNGEA
jgi:hypothetical protein